MITYTEKGIGLHDAIAEAGYTLANIDGVWVSNDDVAVQAIIDAYQPDPLADLEAVASEYIKFGTELADTVASKIWAYHVYLGQTGVLITAEDLAAILVPMDMIRKMMQTGAVTQAQAMLADLKIALPQYTDMIDYATNEIVAWRAQYES